VLVIVRRGIDMAFLWGKKKPESEEPPVSESERQERVTQLQKDIRDLEETVFGVSLFCEGLCSLHAGEQAVVETYQKQFRNVLQTDVETIRQARVLLDTVNRDPSQAALLRSFIIEPCKSHSNPKELARRAAALVNVYDQTFPGRPRAREFTDDEMFQLIETAAGAFGQIRIA
jgi:hypothetical protein